MSDVAVENSQNEIQTSTPSRRDQHWVEKSIEDIADDYFSHVNPLAKKIILDKKQCQKQHSDWDHLDHSQKNEVLNDYFIDASLKLRYELKLGIIERPKPENNFPRKLIQGGTKMVTYRDEDGSNSKAKSLTWKDEFSGPFSWETKCQQELSVINESNKETPAPESLLPELDSPTSTKDSSLSPKSAQGEQHANSMMVMKDVTKRHSFGSNLLASLEERLAFDQAVGDAVEGKKADKKEYQHIGHVDTKLVHAGGESTGSPRLSGRKPSEHNYKSPTRDNNKFKPSKPKMAPPGPGPKPRDIPKYTDPPMYHKSDLPKYNDPPKYKVEQMEPPTQSIDRGKPPPMQSIDRGRPTNEPPKQPKISRPKVEPPKPRTEPPKPKTPKTDSSRAKSDSSKPKTDSSRPKTLPPQAPNMIQASRPKMQPPKQPGKARPSMEPPQQPIKTPQQPTNQWSEKPSSPRRQAKKDALDKVQLLPSPDMQDMSKARSQTLPATPHENVCVEVKEEKGSASGDEASTKEAGGDGATFDFLMAW